MFSDIEEYCIDDSATLLEAMSVIDRGAAGIALVVTADRRLLGTLTDGDIRRAIIGGASLDSGLSAYTQNKCLCVAADAGRAEVLDLMQSRLINQVPVLNDAQQLVGFAFTSWTARNSGATQLGSHHGRRERDPPGFVD
jgi:CBS domain-containing protein